MLQGFRGNPLILKLLVILATRTYKTRGLLNAAQLVFCGLEIHPIKGRNCINLCNTPMARQCGPAFVPPRFERRELAGATGLAFALAS